MGATADSEASRSETWTTRRLLRWIDGHLASKGVESPRVCAEMLLSHVLGCERLRLYMDADRPASPDELERLRALVVRAGRHEPVQYLVGEAWFWSKRFAVGPATLIPRPATEHLVEECIAIGRAAGAARGGEPVRILEIGTGTGCIAVCVACGLAGQSPRGAEAGGAPRAPAVAATIVATDLVPGALELAQANARSHGVAGTIDWRAGSLYAPLQAAEQGSFDLIVSNPPYVADEEWSELAPNVRDFEPRTALAGGPGGLDTLRPLLEQAPRWLRPGGRLVVEIGHRQRDAVLALAAANPRLQGAEVRPDFEGFWRMFVATARG